jgi:hypothetical protein
MIIHHRYRPSTANPYLFDRSVKWLSDNIGSSSPHNNTPEWTEYLEQTFTQCTQFKINAYEYPSFLNGQHGPGWLIIFANLARMYDHMSKPGYYLLVDISDELMAMQFKLAML